MKIVLKVSNQKERVKDDAVKDELQLCYTFYRYKRPVIIL
jgi:hypothetical protein